MLVLSEAIGGCGSRSSKLDPSAGSDGAAVGVWIVPVAACTGMMVRPKRAAALLRVRTNSERSALRLPLGGG